MPMAFKELITYFFHSDQVRPLMRLYIHHTVVGLHVSTKGQNIEEKLTLATFRLARNVKPRYH